MRKSIVVLSGFILMMFFACTTNPFTGKSQFNVVSNDQIFPASFQQYDAFIKENKVITGTAEAKMVTTVGQKIRAAAEKYLNANGYQGYLKDYQWEYHLVQDPSLNAWCMPGGKIVVYSGILPVTKTEAGLATVMGHEVSHALLNHGGQRMTASQAQQVGAVLLGAATTQESEAAQQIYMQAYGVGSNVLGMLPFSRSHETEADKYGLILMAIAGYNPDEAIAFWQRMSAQGAGGTPELLSTHPSDATRIANLQKMIPEAKAEAAKFGVTFK